MTVEIPISLITTAVTIVYLASSSLIVWTVSKIYGTIKENKVEHKEQRKQDVHKSEEMDKIINQRIDESVLRIEDKIKDLIRVIEKIDDKYRNNDREHYRSIDDLRIDIEKLKGILDCMRK